jgi:hypothetical protein
VCERNLQVGGVTRSNRKRLATSPERDRFAGTAPGQHRFATLAVLARTVSRNRAVSRLRLPDKYPQRDSNSRHAAGCGPRAAGPAPVQHEPAPGAQIAHIGRRNHAGIGMPIAIGMGVPGIAPSDPGGRSERQQATCAICALWCGPGAVPERNKAANSRLLRAQYRPSKGPAQGPFCCVREQRPARIGLDTVFARTTERDSRAAARQYWPEFRLRGRGASPDGAVWGSGTWRGWAVDLEGSRVVYDRSILRSGGGAALEAGRTPSSTSRNSHLRDTARSRVT